jgi:hypothetical protein
MTSKESLVIANLISESAQDSTSFVAPGMRIDLDDLPRYSIWPAKLLNNTGGLYEKTRTEILREFDQEKWSELLARLRTSSARTLAQLETLMFSASSQMAYSIAGEYYRSTPSAVNKMYKKFLEQHLAHAKDVTCIAEIGAGAGNLIMHLAKSTQLAKSWIAYELTDSGRAITTMVANTEDLPVAAEFLDFDDPRTMVPSVAERMTYFSSFALAYCKEPEVFIESLVNGNTKEIVLLEPIYQFFDETTLSGLLAKSYFEKNDYSKGLFPAIQKLSDKGVLKSDVVKKNGFAHNPLCPISVIRLWPK